jgi:predicted nucleotidyltransferase
MILPDWPDARHSELLRVVTDRLDDVVVRDIFAVGSRVGGWARDDSDIDVVVWIEPIRHLPRQFVTRAFDGIPVSVTYDDRELHEILRYRSRKVDEVRFFQLPFFSLLSGDYIKGDESDIRNFLTASRVALEAAGFDLVPLPEDQIEDTLARVRGKPPRFVWDRRRR